MQLKKVSIGRTQFEQPKEIVVEDEIEGYLRCGICTGWTPITELAVIHIFDPVTSVKSHVLAHEACAETLELEWESCKCERQIEYEEIINMEELINAL